MQNKHGFLIASAAMKEPGMRKVVHSVHANIPKVGWRMSTAEYSIDLQQQQSWLSSTSNEVSCFVGSVSVSYSHHPHGDPKVIAKTTENYQY